MSLFTKTGPWMVATLSAVASIFGQNSKCAPAQKSFEQGHEMMQSQMMAGYNAPARIDVRGSWDLYASGSFTYWQAIQENMELGVVSNVTNPVYVINGDVVNFHSSYRPGFQVELGMNFDHDNWDTLVRYTWFRGTHTTETNLDPATPATQLVPFWTVPGTTDGAYLRGVEKWQLHMDILDWELARSSYVGTKLSFRPFFAARAAWIRQNVDVDYYNSVTLDTATRVGRSSDVNQKAHSWAVGPRAGLYTNWMLGQGFRMYGNGGADILFTQYTRLKFSEDVASTSNVVFTSLVVKQRKANYLRTHLDLELGFGWGSYFDNNNWHVDLSAGYGFQVFYDQNMFRHFTSDQNEISTSISPNGNLYMHGLTAKVRFDF